MESTMKSEDRIERLAPKKARHKINLETYRNLQKFSDHPELIEERIQDLKHEWDFERTLEANASTLSLIGLALGYFVNPYWLLVPAVAMSFLLQHAIQGWCPPLPLFRMMGKRTFHEIEEERHALKALRGDYSHVESPAEALEDSMRD